MDNSYIGAIGTKVETTDTGEIGEFCGYATIVDTKFGQGNETSCYTIPVIKFEIMDHGAWTTDYRLYDTEYLEWKDKGWTND
jgi:hypothetical protein